MTVPPLLSKASDAIYSFFDVSGEETMRTVILKVVYQFFYLIGTIGLIAKLSPPFLRWLFIPAGTLAMGMSLPWMFTPEPLVPSKPPLRLDPQALHTRLEEPPDLEMSFIYFDPNQNGSPRPPPSWWEWGRSFFLNPN